MKTELSLKNPATIRAYFEKVRELMKSGDKYPVNLDEVWPLVYAKKQKAVDLLKKECIENEEYEVFTHLGKNPKGGRPELEYRLSVSCMEHLIARKSKEVFEVYRQVFHAIADQLEKAQNPQIDNLIVFTERPKQLANSKEVNSFNYQQGGQKQTIDYNRKNCFYHTGRLPHEILAWAKAKKWPAKNRTSAKEVIRTFKPAMACSMALADDFCKTGKIAIEESATFCKTHALPLFEKMAEFGLLASPQKTLPK